MDQDAIREAEGEVRSFENVVSFTMHFDGAARGNPGLAGAGMCIHGPAERKGRRCIPSKAPGATWDEAIEMLALSSYLGKATNNEAEYRALLDGLCAVQHSADGMRTEMGQMMFGEVWEVRICGDSELVIKQMRGQYRVTAANLRPLHARACKYVDNLREMGVRLRFEHVRREQNRRADQLANEAIDTITVPFEAHRPRSDPRCVPRWLRID